MKTEYLDLAPQHLRREQWYQAVRNSIPEFIDPDGTPRIPQFSPAFREPLWIAPALFTGTPAHIAMINRIIAHWHDEAATLQPEKPYNESWQFDIFRSTSMIHLFHRFRDRIMPEAEKVMRVHIEHGTRTFYGSGQPDTKFHGANDNMPMNAAYGLIFAGEILGDEEVLRHGWWQLHQFRLLLSRAAWASEYNSSTYSAVTLAAIAGIATRVKHPEIRALALEIEHRLWAELLLHYHPGTFMQSGPQSRAYTVDTAGHTHSLQFLYWLVFGPEKSGRDPLRSYFHPDGREVLHFQGAPIQNIAEFVHFIDTDFHVPVDLASLIEERNYPARLRGRSEGMGSYEGRSPSYHTQTYMEKEFSLGTVDVPMGGGPQTCSLYGTYQRKPDPADFRDAATFFCKYAISNPQYGLMKKSHCGRHEGEEFVDNEGWLYTLQKDNSALVVATPNLLKAPLETTSLRLDFVFPAHYGRIRRSIIGDEAAQDGARGEHDGVVPVSVEAGEVFIHLWPLIPTNLPRPTAVRFVEHQGRYEVLQLINYEGPSREFSRGILKEIVNGAVITIEAKKKYGSLEEFHRLKSAARIVDYMFADLRFLEFERPDVWFQLTYSPNNPGAQTEAVDGRHVEQPVFASSQLDVNTLPFMTGPVAPNFPMFRWNDSMDVRWYPKLSWLIGSRGLPGEVPYSRRNIKTEPSGE